MIIALAGRRVDAPDAEQKRFPAENAGRIQELIREALISVQARALVCAAACGADIIALEVAGELGLRRRVVLPYDKESFKRISVTDRPGDWGGRYDRILSEVEASGDLVDHDYDESEEATYFAANHDILDAAEELAMETEQELVALVVWDGESRGEDDVTGHLLQEAKQRGLRTKELNTLTGAH
ncbi:MAG: hypothetical protein ACREB3_13360 [Burkholderiales bacterium]